MPLGPPLHWCWLQPCFGNLVSKCTTLVCSLLGRPSHLSWPTWMEAGRLATAGASWSVLFRTAPLPLQTVQLHSRACQSLSYKGSGAVAVVVLGRVHLRACCHVSNHTRTRTHCPLSSPATRLWSLLSWLSETLPLNPLIVFPAQAGSLCSLVPPWQSEIWTRFNSWLSERGFARHLSSAFLSRHFLRAKTH